MIHKFVIKHLHERKIERKKQNVLCVLFSILPKSNLPSESTDSVDGGVVEEEYSLQCIYCPAGDAQGIFPTASLLRDHMRQVHPGQPTRYQCPKCEQTFLQKSHLDKHLALHSPTSQACKVQFKLNEVIQPV